MPEEKIAAALDLSPRSIMRKARLLDGICEEAAAILKDKPCTAAVFDALRKMKTLRQIESAELLVNANNFSVAYANAILAGTPQVQLVELSKPKKVKGITPEAMARMERELARLQEGIASKLPANSLHAGKFHAQKPKRLMRQGETAHRPARLCGCEGSL